MKPPPRTRNKPDRNLKPEPVPQRKWQRMEHMRLLKGLKRLSRTAGNGDIDYTVLRKYVPSRSISELHTLVESLKNKVISCASVKYKKKRWEEKKARKPIELWTYMASSMAGTLEETITTAFSQMLIVSSTEPRTLRNCDPPQIHRLPTAERPAGRTVPWRPTARLPAQGEGPGTNTAHPLQVLKTPAPSLGPAVKVPKSKICLPQQQLSTTAGTTPAATFTSPSAATSCQPVAAKIVVVPLTSPQPASQAATLVTGQVPPSSSSAAVAKTLSAGSSVIQTTQQPSEQHPTTITTTSATKSTSSSPHTPLSSSITSLTPVPSTAPSSLASSSSAPSSHSTATLSTPAATIHTRFGCISKSAAKGSPRMLGVKCIVDFERIYRYLSAIHKPNDECHLTPMESAIVLDLLMSLPEELPLLDCNKLHKHLIQDRKWLIFGKKLSPAPHHISPSKTWVQSALVHCGWSILDNFACRSPERSEVDVAPCYARLQQTNGGQFDDMQVELSGVQYFLEAVYQCLSSPADSKMAREMFKELKGGLGAQTATVSSQDSSRTNSQPDAVGTADSTEVTDNGGKKVQPDEAESQSSSNNDTSSQSGDADLLGHCPPLNPFMVPLKLLMHR